MPPQILWTGTLSPFKRCCEETTLSASLSTRKGISQQPRIIRASSAFGAQRTSPDLLLARLTRNVRCYGATQAGNPGVRRFLDRLGIARVASGNKNRLNSQPSQVVK